jgi:hypothetical protein
LSIAWNWRSAACIIIAPVRHVDGADVDGVIHSFSVLHQLGQHLDQRLALGVARWGCARYFGDLLLLFEPTPCRSSSLDPGERR